MEKRENASKFLQVERSFAELIRYYRIRCGLSQNKLARSARIDPAYINRLEKGHTHTPSRAVVLSIAEVLELGYGERENFLHVAGLSTEIDWRRRALAAEYVLSDLDALLQQYQGALSQFDQLHRPPVPEDHPLRHVPGTRGSVSV